MNLIFLIGMPGVGKSYWGRIWSGAYGYDFADLDEHVEAQAGVPIPDIFGSVGEEGFRILEAGALLDSIAAARGRNTIIATGGGTPAYDHNMDAMLRTGFVVYLTAKTSTLLKHIADSGRSRPLLQCPDARVLELLLEERKVFYERAHLGIAVEKAGAGTFAQILKACTGRQS